jgi:hypothetical protein
LRPFRFSFFEGSAPSREEGVSEETTSMLVTRYVRGLWLGVALVAGCRGEKVHALADAGAPPDDADTEQYVADVTFVASERTPGSAHWQEVQDFCAKRLADLGYEVERQAYGTGVNVIGLRRGTSIPDEQIFISGHYSSHACGAQGGEA